MSTNFTLDSTAAAWITLIACKLDAATRRSLGERIDMPDVQLERSPAMAAAVARLDLSRGQEIALWALVASQLDAQVAHRLEALSGTTDPTLGALAQIAYIDNPATAIEELGPRGALARFVLIELMTDARAPEAPFTRRTLRVADRVLSLALGMLSLDPELACARLPEPSPALEALAMAESSLTALTDTVRLRDAVVLASGTPGLGRRTALLAAAARSGIEVLEVDARKIAPDSTRKVLRQVVRESKLLQRTPLIANLDAIDAVLAAEELSNLPGLVLATTRTERLGARWNRPCVPIAIEPPSAARHGKLWIESLGQGTETDASILADRHPLAPALIPTIARSACALARGRKLEPADIALAIRTTLDDRIGGLARRIVVTQSWRDLVLAPDEASSVAELIARIRQRRRVYESWGFGAKIGRGHGTTALLSGPPGTGKTMVCGLMARELGLELYQVDVSRLVSKWVGETEKQLAELFDAAESGHAILLFDEADSVFGKRTEVKSSNDRYANLESNFLLQRLEAYTGICLLTSNRESDIDSAFQRRLAAHVRFAAPDEQQRARLWRAVLPAEAPVDAMLDFNALAQRFELCGGHIKNAVLRAAFAAADRHERIGQHQLEQAALAELRGLGRVA